MTPDKYTIAEKKIDVGDGHELYAQLWGNKKAKTTIIFLHGGPGSGCSDGQKQLFEPTKQRVLFFDQRGCGKSTPYGSLKDNNTEKMINDINFLADYFGLDKFVITGGSWGSCLALAYAIRRPQRVICMVLRGLLTGRKTEIDFLDKGEMREFYPDVWDELVNSVPEPERNNPAEYHSKRMLGSDKRTAKESAYAYARYISPLASISNPILSEKIEDFDPIPTIIECYYVANGFFLPGNYIMENVSKLTMPIDLVQGRYDAICPPAIAYELHKKLPNSTLTWTTAGHYGLDPENIRVVAELLLKI